MVAPREKSAEAAGLRNRKRDIMLLVMVQVAIALVLVPIAERANKIHLMVSISLAILLGAMEVFCFKFLWEALGNLARASRMAGANDPDGEAMEASLLSEMVDLVERKMEGLVVRELVTK